MIDIGLIAISCAVTSQEEALRYGADKLYALGLVSDDYADEVVKREAVYPTGIKSYVNFAICHTDTCHSKNDGLCMMVLEDPIPFHSMEEPSEIVDVKVIFILASTSPDGHMHLLQDIIRIMSDGESAARLISAGESELKGLLENSIMRS